MLLRQNRCRHQHRNLLALNCRLEGRTDRDFRFAITYVAAEQTVHRTALLHILLDLLDRPQLIRGFLVREHPLEFLLLGSVLLEGIPRRGLPFGVQLDQIVGNVLYRGTDLVFHAGPFVAAQLVNLRLLILGTDVFLNHVNLFDRHRQLIPAGI
ncbi:hypothetical protein D3C74_267070 [compost metagenome]